MQDLLAHTAFPGSIRERHRRQRTRRRAAAKRTHANALTKRGYNLADLASEQWQHAQTDYFQPRTEQGRLF